MNTISESFTDASASKVIARVIEQHMLANGSEEGTTMACGMTYVAYCVCSLFPQAFKACDTEAFCGGALTLLRHVCPSPLPAEWWVSTCAEVDVTSVRLTLLMQPLGNAKVLDQAALESVSWLGPAVTDAVHICKVNASAGLSARPTMSGFTVAYALTLMETVARVESHAASLLDWA